jgi:hypothetical protein
MNVRKLNHSVCTRSAEWLSAEAKASASFVAGSPLLEMVSSPMASRTSRHPAPVAGSMTGSLASCHKMDNLR